MIEEKRETVHEIRKRHYKRMVDSRREREKKVKKGAATQEEANMKGL